MLDVQIRPRLTTTCASLAIVLAATAGCSEQTSGPDLEAPEVVPVVTGANPTTMPLGLTFDLHVFGSGFEAVVQAAHDTGAGIHTHASHCSRVQV